MTDPVIPNPIKQSQLQTGLSPQTNQQPKGQTKGGMQGPVEIIRASAQKEIPGSDPEQIVKQIAVLVQRKTIQLLQLGNTVFVIYPQQDGSVEFHTFTTEDPQTLAQRYKMGANSLKQMGFKKAVTYATSPAFVKIARQTGLPVQISQSMQKIGNKTRKAYRFEVNL